MQRNFLRGLLVCLIPLLVAALFAVRLDKYRLGIDLAGGTILVYEINQERLNQRRAQGAEDGPQPPGTAAEDGLSSDEMNQLAAQIKRRIDPADIKNVTVRPLGRTRFEIILPTGGAAGGREAVTAEYIEEVKRLISQMGVLEFRILANGTDDAEGLQRAKDAANDPDKAAARADAARDGRAPDGPAEKFNVEVNRTTAPVEYKWVELGPEEREAYGLANAQQGSPLWNLASRNRGKAFLVGTGDRAGDETDDPKTASFALFSRDVDRASPQAAREVAAARRAVAANELPEALVRNPDGSPKTDEQVYDAILASPEAVEKLNPKRFEYFILTRVTPRDVPADDYRDSLKVEGDVTLNATVGQDRVYNPAVDFTFNGAGAQLFGRITRRNSPTREFKRHLAIILDDKMVSAPTLDGEITSRGQITGKFDRKTVERLVNILRSGALSAELKEKPVSENTIGPTLGRDTIRKGTLSIGLAFLAVLAFMLVYYRFAGLVACVALLANLLLTVGFMVAVNAAFTLPGLAGLVLCLGMAVDANILIYERIREERDKGANIATAVRNGYDRAFPTIIDTHLTSIFTAVVLYTFGNDNLKGFAITLTLGLLISLFTSLYMTRLMFDYWYHRRWLTELGMMRLFGKLRFRPMKYRWLFFPLTAALTLAGLALFVSRGDSVLNVDFRGGTVFEGRLRDGEERALTAVGDKPGFRDLLADPARQQTRLAATAARWENRPPDGNPASVNSFVYTITYADGTTATVTLSQRPAGATEEEMAADVVARARQLPDVSVEQTFRTGESYPDGKSRYFTIRTTERQPELVRLALDRLLRDDQGRTLMAGATMAVPEGPGAVPDAAGKEVPGPAVGPDGTVVLTFSEPTSRNYVQDLLDREFRTVLVRGTEPARFTLTGDESTRTEGRYRVMTLNVSEDPAFDQFRAGATPDPAARARQLQTLGRVLAGVRQAFDSTPEPERLEVFDSQLAGETRMKAFYAILASWIAILLYLWFRFGNWTFGLAAVLCLIHDLCFVLGAIAACHYLHHLPGMHVLGIQDFKIDLAAVAALLTLVGFSVNDTIVVFDRIREVRGKNPRLTPEMIDESVNQTLSRTILTATTVFLVSIVLYIFGGESIHLFAFVMVVGVLVGTYSSIFVAAPLLLMFGEGDEGAAADAGPDEPADRPGKEEEEVVEG